MSNTQDNDTTVFPDDVYKRTVLAPLFDGAKAYFVEPVKQINRAHLVMLGACGILNSAQCRAIAVALLDIDAELDPDKLQYTGEHEDYFFLVEAELQSRLGADLGGLLHTARSRNDMDHTIFKMVLRERSERLCQQVIYLAECLLNKATQERDTLIVAYTHGQPAQPTTLGHYLCAALEVLLRDINRLLAATEQFDRCPMGAAAITTSGFPIDRQQMAELLGFKEVLLNSYGCIASIDYVTGFYSAMKLMFLHLGRVIQDFQFWTAFEVGQLYIPNSLVQISSIMPQKRNPVPIEHLRHLASMTCGRCDAVINTMHNTPFTDMNDSEGEVQQAGYAGFDSAGRVIDLLASVISQCSVRAEQVANNSDRACITVTELADSLVRIENISFRQAHQIAAETATAVLAQDLALGQGYEAFAAAFNRCTQRATVLDQSQYSNSVSARTFVNVRERPGGPAPMAMDSALSEYRAQLNDIVSQVSAQRAHRCNAADNLEHRFTKLTETVSKESPTWPR